MPGRIAVTWTAIISTKFVVTIKKKDTSFATNRNDKRINILPQLGVSVIQYYQFEFLSVKAKELERNVDKKAYISQAWRLKGFLSRKRQLQTRTLILTGV